MGPAWGCGPMSHTRSGDQAHYASLLAPWGVVLDHRFRGCGFCTCNGKWAGVQLHPATERVKSMKPLYPHHLFGTLSGVLLIALFMVEYPAPSSTASRPLDGRGPLERSERIADATGIAVEHSDTLGAYLADRDGRALYLFKADSTGESTCYNACTDAWTPLCTHSTPRSGNPLVIHSFRTHCWERIDERAARTR
jgi:hypothetical protein